MNEREREAGKSIRRTDGKTDKGGSCLRSPPYDIVEPGCRLRFVELYSLL